MSFLFYNWYLLRVKLFFPRVYFSALAPLVPFSHLSTYPFYHDNVSCKVRGRGRFLSPTVSHSYEGTGKLRKTCAEIVGHSLWDLIFVIDISITNTNPQSSTSRSTVRSASWHTAKRSLIQVLTVLTPNESDEICVSPSITDRGHIIFPKCHFLESSICRNAILPNQKLPKVIWPKRRMAVLRPAFSRLCAIYKFRGCYA